MEDGIREEEAPGMIGTGIVVVSDRAARGEVPDGTGPQLRAVVEEQGWTCHRIRIVPDDCDDIARAILGFCDEDRLELVLTAGGTGLGPRDVTPEATAPLLDRRLEGLTHLILSEGIRSTPRAALSRGIAGIRKGALIVNLPGSPRGAEESLRAIVRIIPHALAMLRGEGHPGREGEGT